MEIDLNTIRHGRPIDQWFSIDSPSATTSAERAVSPISTRRHDNLSGPASADGSFLTLNSLGSHANRGYGALRIKLIFTVTGRRSTTCTRRCGRAHAYRASVASRR